MDNLTRKQRHKNMAAIHCDGRGESPLGQRLYLKEVVIADVIVAIYFINNFTKKGEKSL